MSVEFLGVGGLGQIGAMKKAEKSQTGKKTGESQGDQVQFSSVLQDVQKAQTTSATAQSGRNVRVQELKAQVADGSYQPDLNKVATSLMQFLLEERQL